MLNTIAGDGPGDFESGDRQHQLHPGDAVHGHRSGGAMGAADPAREVVEGRKVGVVEEELDRAGCDPGDTFEVFDHPDAGRGCDHQM
jgi:hypothetical protein